MLALMKNDGFVLKDGKLQFVQSSSSNCECCNNCVKIRCPNFTGGVWPGDEDCEPFYEVAQPVNGVQFSFACSDTIEAEAELSYKITNRYSDNVPFIRDCYTANVYSKRFIKVSGLSALNGTYGSIKSPFGINFNTCEPVADPCELNPDHPCCNGENLECRNCTHTLFVPYKLVNWEIVTIDIADITVNGVFYQLTNYNNSCSFQDYARASIYGYGAGDPPCFTNPWSIAFPEGIGRVINGISSFEPPSTKEGECFTEIDVSRNKLISNKYGLKYWHIGWNSGFTGPPMYTTGCLGGEEDLKNACFFYGGYESLDYNCRKSEPQEIRPFTRTSCEYNTSLDLTTPLPPDPFSSCPDEIIEEGFFRSRVSQFNCEGELIFI